MSKYSYKNIIKHRIKKNSLNELKNKALNNKSKDYSIYLKIKLMINDLLKKKYYLGNMFFYFSANLKLYKNDFYNILISKDKNSGVSILDYLEYKDFKHNEIFNILKKEILTPFDLNKLILFSDSLIVNEYYKYLSKFYQKKMYNDSYQIVYNKNKPTTIKLKNKNKELFFTNDYTINIKKEKEIELKKNIKLIEKKEKELELKNKIKILSI